MEEGIGAHGERLSELNGEIVALCGIVDDDHDDVKVSEAHADLADPTEVLEGLRAASTLIDEM